MQLFFQGLHIWRTGFWLGILRPAHVILANQYYETEDSASPEVSFYSQDLYAFERRAIENHFQGCRRFLVAGVSAARELVGLHKAGFEATGLADADCLAEQARAMLDQSGLDIPVLGPGDDRSELTAAPYDGLYISLGVYSRMPGRDRRIAYLRTLRQHVADGAPLLLSFYYRLSNNLVYRLSAAIGTCIGILTFRGVRVEVGDDIEYCYAHYFSEQELREELQAAGFDLVQYSIVEYSHAIARASQTLPDKK